MTELTWEAFLYGCVNFLLLTGLLYYFLHKPVLRALEQRRERIQDAQSKAQSQFEEARASQQQYEKKLSEIERERDQMLSDARKKAEEARERSIEEARIDARRETESIKASFERERTDALRRMREEIVGTSVELARTILTKAADRDLHRALVQGLVRELDDVKADITPHTREGLVQGGAPVRVISAEQIEEDQLKDIRAGVVALVGKEVEFSFEMDESLIVGARVELSSMAVDASLADALDEFEEKLKQHSAPAEQERDELDNESRSGHQDEDNTEERT